MLSDIETRFNKKISSVIAVTYFSLLIVVSFHFHNLSAEYLEILSENKSSASELQGDIVHSNGMCQFLMNYKSSVDFLAYTGVETKFQVIKNFLSPGQNNFNNSPETCQNLLRAPPSAPYISL